MRKKNMKIKLLFMFAALVVLSLSVAFSPVSLITETEAQSSDKKERQKKAEKVTQKSEKGSGTADDKNVTATRTQNSKTSKSTRTTSRGSGQRTCNIDLNNETGYVIDIYIDGRYRGTMGEFDSNYTTTGSGATRLYARAEFSDGSYLYWGPKDMTCGSNSRDGYFEWTLTD